MHKSKKTTKKINYKLDSFDEFLLNALKEKIGRDDDQIIKMALQQLYTDLCIPKQIWSNWQIPDPTPIYPEIWVETQIVSDTK